MLMNNIVFFPFVIRFNILKRLVCKEALERHQTFKIMCGYFSFVFLVIAIQFVVNIVKAMGATLPNTPSFYSDTTYETPPYINTSQAFEMPSSCQMGGSQTLQSKISV